MEILTLKIDRFATPRLGPFEELIADRELIAPDDVNIPDLWHVVEGLKESQPNAAAALLASSGRSNRAYASVNNRHP